MKKSLVSQLAVLLMMSTTFFSCKKSDDVPKELLPNTNGVYIYGSNTVAAAATDPAARMALAILDPSKPAKITSLDSVYGKFMYIGANSTIKFAAVSPTSGKVFGAENGGTTDSASNVPNCGVKDIVVHGTLKENGPDIKVAKEGLYYAYLNMNTGLFILMPVRGNVIGDATVLQWAKGTFLPQTYVGLDSSVFTGTNIEMDDAHGYRYRFNDGWATYDDGVSITLLGSLGVFSYADAWASGINNIGFFNDNIPHKVTGLYTIKLKYNAADGSWTEKKTKTGNVLINYTDIAVGLEGSAYIYAPKDTGKFSGDGTDGYQVKKPTSISGTTYTWTYTNVSLITGGEFIFLQQATWGAGLQVDASTSTLTGAAITAGDIVDATAAPFSEPYHNWKVVNGVDKNGAGPTYDLTLTVDAATGKNTIIFVRH